jgi:hypothetical protein
VEVGLRHPTAAGVLLPPDPPRVHRRLADVYVEEDTAFAAAAARHFAACGDVASARECWLRAGNWALGEGAFASAAECLKSARQLGAGLESLGDALGRALVGSGAIEEGASVWRETADRLGGAERVRLRGLAAGLLVATGCVTEGHETYDQLMLDIGQRPLPGNVGSLWSLLTTRELPAPLPGLPEPTAEQAAALDALWAAGMALARHEPLPGLAALARHRALAARVHAPAHHVLALAALRWSHSVVRIDRERVERHLDAVLAALPGGAAAAPQLLGPRVWGYVLGSEALEALLSARFAESAEAGRRADAAFGAEQSQSWEGRSIAINSLNARVWQIDQRALRREVDLAVEASLVVGDGTHALAAELAVGVRVTLITEGLGAATARLERALARWRRPMTAELSFRHRALRAELAFFRGDENGFEQEAGSTPLAERSFLAYPLTQAHFHWLRGRLAARRGGVGGLRALRRAIDGLRSLPGAACTGLAEALEAKEAAILGDEARSAALRARAAVTLPAEGYALIGELTHGGARAWPCPGLAPPPGVVDYIAG